jgi:2-polyprenyl-3-methyl-5-hydroxy-6-metoxy-1,4-benzoquinol methylase
MVMASADEKEYYNKYWLDHEVRLNNHEVIRLAEILKAMALVLENYKNHPHVIEICDFGCGRGWLSNELSKFGKVTGVDFSEKGIELARERWKSVSNFEVQEIISWRPPKKYDIVVSSEVIEHIKQKDLYAETIKNILKPGGFLILTTPNKKVKRAWDKGGMGAQIVEEWLSSKELKNLFSDFMSPIFFETFIFDFSYSGIFRILSAPKLLTIIKKLGVMNIYNAFRSMNNMGLYQIYVARFNGP